MRAAGLILGISHHLFNGACRVITCSICFLLMVTEVKGQPEISIFSELDKSIRAPGAVAKLGPDLFGDKVNLYNGQLSFEQTDIDLPGRKGLEVAVKRRLRVGEHPSQRNFRAFGVWDLDIPYLYGVFSASHGWRNNAGTNARCSNFTAPLPFLDQGTYTFEARDYWNGNMLHIPGQEDQLMMARHPDNTMTPEPPSSYPVVTGNSWVFSCISKLIYNDLGEGFLARSPEGITYRFDHMVSLQYPTLMGGSPNGSGASSALAKTSDIMRGGRKGTATNPVTNAAGTGAMARKEVRIYPTLINDRYGNWVAFSYDYRTRNLRSVLTNDGRKLEFSYENSASPYLITSVTTDTRTWTYTYSGPYLNLDTVTQPDGSTWSLSGINPLLNEVQYAGFYGGDGCNNPAIFNSPQRTGSMEHPSGASATFTLTPTVHGRSNVTELCLIDAGTGQLWNRYPRYYYTQALTSKTLSGPGILNLDWHYDYGAPNASWSTCTSNCPSTKLVTVTDPADFVTRYTFGNVYQETDGRLQKEEVGWDGSTALRTTEIRYRSPTAGPYPQFLGSSGTESVGDSEMMERPRPVDQRVITQQGEAFTWQSNAFDIYRRPLNVTRSSTLGNSRSETTVYSDNEINWVLGQIESVMDGNTGQVILQNTYDAITADLLTTVRFGLLTETRTYNKNGTLLTSKDGLNQPTAYGIYKGVIPQLTTYADGTSTRVLVQGGLITMSSDEFDWVRYFKYDVMRRLSSIKYPIGEGWNETTIQFEKVSISEYGIAAGHWRSTVTTGNAKHITYFDALWRPVLSRSYDTANEANTSSMVLRRFSYNGAITFESYPQRTISAVTDALNGTLNVYDALGRITQVVADSELGPLNTGVTYDAGFKKTVTNPRGYPTVYGYQAFDNPVEDAIVSIVQPYGYLTTINRDDFGKTTSIVKGDSDRSATRSYVYDAHARLCKIIEPETGATVLSYDAANNIKWRAIGVHLLSTTTCDEEGVTADKKITYDYDMRNRLLTTTFGDGSPSISRTLFADDLPATVSSNGTVWNYTYNRRRLLKKESLAYAGKTYNFTRSYDANGGLASLSYPGASALSINFSPNALGQATAVGSYANNINYAPNGALSSFNYGSGAVHSRSETTRGMTYQVRDDGVMFDQYTYDQNGNVTEVADLQQGISTRSMGYDALDRLQTATANGGGMWGTANYKIDALDNIREVNISSGSNARSVKLGYDTSNRLTSITGASKLNLGYDSQGNVITRGAAGYVFDQGNRMSSAKGKASYIYDGWGRRVMTAKADGTIITQVYSIDGQLLYGSSAVGIAKLAESRFIYLNGRLLAEAGVAYTHTDGTGSVVARTSLTGAILSRTRYEPYGLTALGMTPTSLGFAGHVNDADTSLIYMQQRYYDPWIARFISVDPLTAYATTGGSFNRYVYANNNPYGFTDPDGRQAISANNATGGVVGAKAATASDGTALGQLDMSKIVVQGFRHGMADFADNNRGVFG